MYSELATKYNEQKMMWAKKSIEGYHSSLKELGINTNTLLDLGGGLGYYSKAFEEAGYLVTLVEQDPVSVKFAREVLKIKNLIEKSSEQFFKDNHRKYDIVFLRHVIEHSTNPNTLLKNVEKCLSERGILIIETDNNAGIELLFRPGTAKFYTDLYRSSFLPSSFLSLMKRRPFAVDPPRHLYGFRIANLSILLRRNSLVPIEVKCYRLGHPIYWPNLPLPTLTQILSNVRHFKLKHLVVNLLDFAFFPLRLLLQHAGMASGICIYARKGTSA